MAFQNSCVMPLGMTAIWRVFGAPAFLPDEQAAGKTARIMTDRAASYSDATEPSVTRDDLRFMIVPPNDYSP